MRLYLDANVIIPLFTTDKFSDRARALVENEDHDLFISDFTAAEFASVIAVRFRRRELDEEQARSVFLVFDTWTETETPLETATSADIHVATNALRRLDLNLRAPDAIHIAIALRLGLTLATFDERMAAAARELGLAVLES